MSEPKKTESFAGNVMKYSIATYLGFGISGAALIIKGVLPAESYAVPASFMAYTMSLMNVGMLGLDQSLLRFYHEPPAGSTGRSMFAACTRLSVLVMLLVGGIGSIFFAKPLAAAFGLGANGAGLVPFLFLNAALYMLVRYLNVLLRLENNVRAYTTETLWMQACLNLIYLLPGSIIKSAALFALPICVGNILQQLYGTVDTLVVGNFCDSAALAAVGTATQPMEILLCVFLGIGNGASILVSQEMGRRNADGLRMLVRTAVWFLYLCAIPVTILAMFVGPALLRLMQVPADAFDYAVLYLRITALGTLGNLGYNMNAGILRGLGDSRSSLLLLLISCLTNIVLDVAFVAVLGMGVAGAALATTIALYLSWLASILYARRNYEGLQFPLLPHGYDKAQLAAILKVGVPLGLNNSLYSVGHVAVQAVYNMQGSVFVAGCSIAGRVTGIAGIAITSFSSAAVVFAGQNLGAGNYRRLQRGMVQITCAAGVVTLLIGLVATVFCRPLLGLFSSDPAVLDAAVRYTWWVLPFIWTYAVFNCMMSFVNGTGAVKYTTVVNLLILWAVRIPAAYILHALGYGTSSMACVSLSYAVGLVAMLGYFLTPEWGKLRRKAKELGDTVTAETEPTL